MRMGRWRFEFEFPEIGWVDFPRYNTDDLAQAKRAAEGVANARALDGKPARFTAVRVVDGWIQNHKNPHATPRDRVRLTVRVPFDERDCPECGGPIGDTESACLRCSVRAARELSR
jgi:hypothetical protein